MRPDASVSSLRSYTDLADHAGNAPPSLVGVTFNLVNAVIGVGVLAMPFCFHESGLILGILLLTCIGLLTEQTIYLLVIAGKIVGAKSYSGTARRTFGARSAFAVDIGVILLNFGTAVAYLDVIGDVLFAWSGCGAAALLLVTAVFVIIPLSSIDDLSKLKSVSVAGAGVYILFSIVVVGVYFNQPSQMSRGKHSWASWKMFRAIPIVTLTFACHTVVFPVFLEFLKKGLVRHEMERQRTLRDVKFSSLPEDDSCDSYGEIPHFERNDAQSNLDAEASGTITKTRGKLLSDAVTLINQDDSILLHHNIIVIGRFRRGVQASLTFCFFMYFFVGLFGALTFVDDTMGDILRNYSRLGGGVTRCVEFFFAVSVVLTYPMVIFPMRESLLIIIEKSSTLTIIFDDHACGVCGTRNVCRSRTVTFFFVILAYLVAVLVPAIEVVFSINGCVLGLSLSFFLPAVMFIRATALKPKRAAAYSSTRDLKWAYGILVVSVPLGVASVIMTLVSLLNPEAEHNANTSNASCT